MTQFLYPEQTMRTDVTYAVIGAGALSCRKGLADLSGHTVIIITNDMADESVARTLADRILGRGCKNVLFCGESSEEMQDIFDEEDREINGSDDIPGYGDFAVLRRFEDIDELPEEIEMCWNEVIVLCSDMSLLRECRRIVQEY